MPLDVQITSDDLKALGKAFRKEEDGRELRRELRTNLRDALAKPRDDARSAIKAMPSRGHAGPSLRAAIAKKTTVEIRFAGSRTGVRLLTKKTADMRGFKTAPRWTNRGTWRRPVYGNREKWVAQTSGAKDWFDGTVKRHSAEIRKAVEDTVRAMRDRLAGK